MMKRMIGLCLVLIVFGLIACESKKDESKDTAEKSEKKVAEIQPEVKQTEKKPEDEAAQRKLEAKKMLTVVCPDCGKDLKKSEDGKMMVCTGCGKEMDMKTFGEMRMKKMLEMMEQMKKK